VARPLWHHVLNSHFEHYRFFPNDPNDVFATEVVATTNYSGSLIFTVGCHSGLNVPDEDMPDLRIGTDWAQAFSRQRASYIGNTGFGYGDSDLIAYSERLMANFAEELGYWGEGPQTVGRALLRAKQRYFNDIATASFSNYDEKVMGIATLYGLPMLRVSMPLTTTVPPGSARITARRSDVAGPAEIISLTFKYVLSTTSTGSFYQIAGEDDLHVSAGRPVQPRAVVDVHQDDTIVHGVLMLGGSYSDVPDFDPMVARIVTDEVNIKEPLYPTQEWYPLVVGSLNRFLSIDGQSREQLIVVPGQYRAFNSTSPTGTERLYHTLNFAVYRAPFTDTDFIAPNIWQVQAYSLTTYLKFRVRVSDDSGSLQRVTMLYRPLGKADWSSIDLNYNGASGWAEIDLPQLKEPIEFYAQAVDPSGNVAASLNHGLPYAEVINGGSSIFRWCGVKSRLVRTFQNAQAAGGIGCGNPIPLPSRLFVFLHLKSFA
jgi:hypothetical protein